MLAPHRNVELEGREVAVLAGAELVTPCGGCRPRLAELALPA